MWDYLALALGAWFAGFFPLTEIYFAVPLALASGLDGASTVFWAVLGNYTPVLLIVLGYKRLNRSERARAWLNSLVSEKVKAYVNRFGVWFVLVVTPWVGVWAMSMTAKALGMKDRLYLLASFVSVLVYAIVLVWLIQAGVSLVESAPL
jgi:uncharacterized membrane protein